MPYWYISGKVIRTIDSVQPRTVGVGLGHARGSDVVGESWVGPADGKTGVGQKWSPVGEPP